MDMNYNEKKFEEAQIQKRILKLGIKTELDSIMVKAYEEEDEETYEEYVKTIGKTIEAYESIKNDLDKDIEYYKSQMEINNVE